MAAFQTDRPVRFSSGDAFAAGYLSAYLAKSLSTTLGLNQPISALAFGNAVAALQKCIAGDMALITRADVRAVLPKRPPAASAKTHGCLGHSYGNNYLTALSLFPMFRYTIPSYSYILQRSQVGISLTRLAILMPNSTHALHYLQP